MLRTSRVALLAVIATCWIADATRASVTWTLDLLPVSSTTVNPGGSIQYQVVGQLGGDTSLGLALWGVDLHASYAIPGGLPRLLPGPQMYNFVRPNGLTNPPGPADDNPLNPSGYGGTPDGDDWLRQMGGGQNTFGNAPESGVPYPVGPVSLGVGLDPVQLAFGTAYLPTTPGVYSLTISTSFANAIDHYSGQSIYGRPIYSVNEAVSLFGQASFDVIVLPEPQGGLLLLSWAMVACRREMRSARRR